MMRRNPSTESPIECPRCGYDQRGVISAWTDLCPLEGTCTECGLTFEWARVLMPDKFEPTWCVEYIHRTRQFPGNCVRTFFRSWRLWWFWSRLQMTHAIRWRRLLLYVMLLFVLPPPVIYTVVQTTVAVYVRATIGPRLAAEQNAALAGSIANLQRWAQSPQFTRVPAQERARIRADLAALQQVNSYSVTVRQPYLLAIAEAILSPTSSSSNGSVNVLANRTAPDGSTASSLTTYSYPVPNQLHSAMSGSIRLAISRRFTPSPEWFDYVRPALLAFAQPSYIALLMVLGFVLLPVSRRKAKVRWRHVGRVALYGLWIPAAMFWLALFALALSVFTDFAPSLMYWTALALVLPVHGVLLICWWAAAINRYLRMPHGWAVALLLAFLGALLVITIQVFWTFYQPNSIINRVLIG